MQKYLEKESGGPVRIRKYDEKVGNQYLIVLDHVTY
jgi:hypothetical protein